MAVNDDDGPRFPCLAIARYMVATMVTVLAIVVIVMVITVDVLRPEEISVSVHHGYVKVTDLSVEVKEYEVRDPVAQPHVGDSSRRHVPTTTVVYKYKAAKFVAFGITLATDNPSGRANIYCTNITVRFLDMPYYDESKNLTATELSKMVMPEMSFTVETKSSHILTRWHSSKNTTMLNHLSSMYGGRRRFTGAVHVAMYISSDTLVGWKRTSPSCVNYFCWPLNFSVGQPTRGSGLADVTCLKKYGDGETLLF